MTEVGEQQPRVRSSLVTAVLVVLAVPFAVFALLRVTGIDGNRYVVAALALTPYVTGAGLLLGVVALVVRRWKTGLLVLVLAGVLVANLAPRLYTDDQPTPVNGRPLKVMSANLYLGQADAVKLVELVRANQVDVVNLLELTPAEVSALDRAGLFSLLPNRVLQAEPGGSGSGIVSRLPLAEISLAKRTPLAQPSARVDLGEGRSVEVVAVHPVPPTESSQAWKESLADLPPATADLPVRLLAGDFNATLDHAALRRLLGEGYVDAADRRGAGFDTTWPDGLLPPPVAIDHVLADDRVAVHDYRVFDLPGSDHDAIFADLTVPA